jgi:amidase
MDATIITRIIEASGTVIGKAVCENLSTGASSFSSATGLVHNPYARGYSTGGSSSGVGNLVASGKVDMGIGCDQGGSIRIPASFCGLYGFKATVGLVPYTGCASYEAMVDHVGPITKTCMDNAILLEVIAGVDGFDDRQRAGTPFPKEVPKYSQLLLESRMKGVKGVKIGILKEGVCRKGINKDVKAKFLSAVKVFEELGATVGEVSVPMHSKAPAFFSVINRMGPTQGRAGRAVGRRQVMLTDFLEKLRGADKSKVRISSHLLSLLGMYKTGTDACIKIDVSHI